MPGSGFEPESSAREAEMIGRTTLTGLQILKSFYAYFNNGESRNPF